MTADSGRAQRSDVASKEREERTSAESVASDKRGNTNGGRVFVFAGTADGRALVTALLERGYAVTASVVSRYGAELLEAAQTAGHDLVINDEPLDEQAFLAYARANRIAAIVDASHPYAVNVSQNAMAAAKTLGLPYVRYERDLTELTAQGLAPEKLHIVHSYEEAAAAAAQLGDVVFLTTGSRNLNKFAEAPALKQPGKTLIARVLPTPEVIAGCIQLGFTPAEIVALQGPFSAALNRELFLRYGADVIVTKNSGSLGGTDTKLVAAAELGLDVVVIDRPVLDYPNVAKTFEEILQYLLRLSINAGGTPMDYIKQPMAIEHRSMEIIAPHLAGLHLNEVETKIYSRMIHASGDVDYAPLIHIHPDAIAAAQKALKAGADIYTDVEMVRTGINKRKLATFGGEVHCRIADPEIAATAKAQGITRSIAAMRSFGKALDGSIVAIGNAPTALYEVLRLAKEEGVRPACIIGIPVGFVGAADSKEALRQNDLVPYITVEGTKGGSPIAAAVVNALMYDIDDTRL